jgi:hypothetical protein
MHGSILAYVVLCFGRLIFYRRGLPIHRNFDYPLCSRFGGSLEGNYGGDTTTYIGIVRGLEPLRFVWGVLGKAS